jgi:hypothetical protein
MSGFFSVDSVCCKQGNVQTHNQSLFNTQKPTNHTTPKRAGFEGGSGGYIFEAMGVKVVSTFQFSVSLSFQIAQTNMTQQIVLSRRFFGDGVDFCITGTGTGTGFARPF